MNDEERKQPEYSLQELGEWVKYLQKHNPERLRQMVAAAAAKAAINIDDEGNMREDTR